MKSEVSNSLSDFKKNYSHRLTPNEIKNKIFKGEVLNLSKLSNDGKLV